jgi:hypothetical protein
LKRDGLQVAGLFYFILFFNDNQLVIYPLKGEKIKPAQA